MLNKSILLNLQLGKSDFVGALITALVFFGINLFMALFSTGLFLTNVLPGLFLNSIDVLMILFFMLRAMNRIFNKSLFAEGGDLLMTLPISARDMVLGKIIAVTMVSVTANIIAIIGTFLPLIFEESLNEIISDVFLLDIIGANTSPIDAALSLAMVPLDWILRGLASSAILFAALLLFNLRRPGRPGIMPWILYFITEGLLSEALTRLTADISFYIQTLISMGVNLMIVLIAVPFCCNILNRKYNY